MVKKLFPILFAALIFSACGNNSGKETANKTSEDAEAVKVEFAALVSNPADFVDKNISVEGKVVHVCMHTGKKMFIVGENPDIRLFISAGENVPKFPVELVGSQIKVEGHIERVVTASTPAEGTMAASLEAAAGSDSLKKGEAVAAKTGEACETEAAVAQQSALGDLMMVYNKHEVVK